MNRKILVLVVLCCPLVLYFSCSTKGYEIEEVEEEYVEPRPPDTIKYATEVRRLDYENPDPEYSGPSANQYESQNKGFSESRPPLKGPFTIQVGAFMMESNALEFLNWAQEQLGYELYYKLLNGLYKVRHGEFATESDAIVVLRKIKDAGFTDAFILQK